MGGPVVLLYGARHPGHTAGLIVQSGFARWDPARLAEGFRRVAGDDVAAIARRSYGGEEVTDQEWARVFAAFGPHLPDQEREAHTPKNLQINSHGMRLIRHSTSSVSSVVSTRRRWSRSASSTPVTPVAAAEEITGALPEGIARLEIIAGAGHFTWKDAPDRYWPMIIQFINGAIGPELVVA
jgi:pimeloyl-ACP methyl ester carboxylesterase